MQTKSLSWLDRPPLVKKLIHRAWENLRNRANNWSGFKGAEHYNLCSVDEHALIKSLIQSNPSQKEFYIMDVGAGNFEFTKALADYLNSQPDIPEDVKIHLVGIRAEKNASDESAYEVIGRCHLYNLGDFQIENLCEELENHPLLPSHLKFDAIFSRWTLRHLVDPLGTFLQIYSMLRSKTGLFLSDGFFYDYNGIIEENMGMQKLLLETNKSFLIYPFDSNNSLDQFILQKSDDEEANLTLRYKKEENGSVPVKIAKNYQIEANLVTCFEGPLQNLDLPKLEKFKNNLYGDKTLYDGLLKANAVVATNYAGAFFSKAHTEIEPVAPALPAASLGAFPGKYG